MSGLWRGSKRTLMDADKGRKSELLADGYLGQSTIEEHCDEEFVAAAADDGRVVEVAVP